MEEVKNQEPITKTQEEIHAKGFNITDGPATDYNKIKIGVKTVQDAVLELGTFRYGRKEFANKGEIMRALADKDMPKLRAISNYFYRTNGIYQKVVNYFATMYRFDWYIVPDILDDTIKEDKILKEFVKILDYLDNSYVKKLCSDIALKVIKDGAYYGYIIPSDNCLVLQELPVDYCRVRWSVGNLPAVEFNMRWFDDRFPDVNYRMRVLNLFPDDFKKGYRLFKEGRLPRDPDPVIIDEWNRRRWNDTVVGDYGSWYLLDPGSVIKFDLGPGMGDLPLFINAIPEIIDLDDAQGLDRQKQMQQLLRIIVQKLPLDKNGDLIFDVDEAQDIHNNAVAMLRRAIGVDVLTTFADVESIDMSQNTTTANDDGLEKVERSVYNALGVSKNLFNTDGNLSLEKSILEDEGVMRKLVLQFQIFFDKITQERVQSKNRKKYNFHLYILETTQYNYKELSKMYKEQVQIGYSKMLPQIALGHSQSSIVNTAYFENNLLHLTDIMIPPLMSSVMSSEAVLGKEEQSSSGNTEIKVEGESTAGRPEKEESEKSDKTLANEESKS